MATPSHPAYILLRDLLLDETRSLGQLETEAQEAQRISTLFVACTDPATAVEDARALYRNGAVHPTECTGVCCTGTKPDLTQVVGGFTVAPTEEETQRKQEDLQMEAQGLQSRSANKADWLSTISAQKTQMEMQYAEEQAKAAPASPAL
jgi:hypothetical protein